MDCPICLTNFDSDSALIPELNCSCVFVVHEECWNKWTNNCLYCRFQPVYIMPQSRRLYQQSLSLKCRSSVMLCLLYFMFIFYLFIFTKQI